MVSHKDIGNNGEDLACTYLCQQGFSILQRNVYIRGGEIDIIAEKDGHIHFVEVKYRTNTKYGYPEDSMSRKKIQTLYRAGNIYANKHGRNMDMCRFDFVGILALPNEPIEYRYIPDIS